MNINHKDLCALYQSFVSERLPESREFCPSLNDLVKFFKPRTTRRFKTRIIDHITRCAPCAQEFDLILEIKRGSEEMDREIAMWLGSKALSRGFSDLPRMVLLHRFWRYAAILVGTVSLSLAVLTVVNKNSVVLFKQYTGRGHIEADIRLIEPINTKVERSHLLFRWKEYDGADSYAVELFDESLRLIWESPKLEEPKYVPPLEMIQKLAPAHTYFWMITINMKNRSVLESELAYFVVADGSTKINP
jgi:hypothetical protein